MRIPEYDPNWPASWRLSHHYDLLEVGLPEVGGSETDRAYSASYRVRRHHTLALVQAVAATGARILDVAAAQGNFTLAPAERGHDMTWNDLRVELAGYVELKRERGEVRYRPGNIFELEDEPYDVVLATEVIEHVTYLDVLLDRLRELTRPGGHVVLTTPNGGYLRNPLPRFSDIPVPAEYEAMQYQPDASGHLWLLDESELTGLATAVGPTVSTTAYFTSPLTAGWLGLGPVTRRVTRAALALGETAFGRLPLTIRRRLATHLAMLLEHTSP